MFKCIGHISLAIVLSSLLVFAEEAHPSSGAEEMPGQDTMQEFKQSLFEARKKAEKIDALQERSKGIETLQQEINQEDKVLKKLKKMKNNKDEEVEFVNIDTSSRIVCEKNTRIDPFFKWIFSGTDISMGALFLSDVGNVISTFTANIGLRYNLTQKAPSMIAERGFSIAGRVGVAYLGYDLFKKNGVGIPVSAELSYVFLGGFLMSVGAEMIYAPLLGDYKESLSVEVYGEIGFADRSGGAIRVGYVIYNDAQLKWGASGALLDSQKVSPLKGTIGTSIHFKL